MMPRSSAFLAASTAAATWTPELREKFGAETSTANVVVEGAGKRAVAAYADDVRERRFPEDVHTYAMSDEERAAFEAEPLQRFGLGGGGEVELVVAFEHGPEHRSGVKAALLAGVVVAFFVHLARQFGDGLLLQRQGQR